MKLEDEITQKRFRGSYHKLAVNILFTGGWLESLIASRLCEHDLTLQQYNVLRILRGVHPDSASVTMLKDRMLDKMSDASRLVDRLETKGLAQRWKCPEDRRRTNIVITERGLALLAELDEVDREMDKLFLAITEDEAALVSDVLDRLRDSTVAET